MREEAVSTRWFGVGHSDAADGESAGAAAARTALAGRQPALMMVFSQVRDDLLKLAEGARSQVSGEVTIAGSSTSGQYASGTTGESGVVVVALGGPGLEVTSQVGHDAGVLCRQAATEAASCLAALTLPHQLLLLLCDGLIGQQHELVRGAYSVAGAAIPLVGGESGDDLSHVKTYQIVGNATGVEVLSDTVVGIGLACESPLGIGIAHGWRKVGEPMVVTRSQDGHVYELDDQPALDAFLRQIGANASIADDPVALADITLRHPLGLSRRGGEDIRVIRSGDPVQRSLLCLADVPQGALVWMMETDTEALIASAAESCDEAVRMLEGALPIGLLGFDCAVRKLVLGPEDTDREIAAVAAAAGPIPYAGWYTNGEIARVRGSRGLHQMTLVTLALS
jgi:hypothetical protein